MDSQRVSSRIDPACRLLALCARVEGHSAFYEQVKDRARVFTGWKDLPAQAEAHGMAPLLWRHLCNSGADVPEETARTLRGLYLRHRLRNKIHARLLMEVMEILRQAGIQPWVLKGLALAYKYYPDPALRPVGDIDLLFKQEEVLPALHLLAEAGFQVEFPFPTSKRIPKSLVIASPPREGIRINIEAHHYDPHGRAPDGSYDDEFKGFDSPPMPVILGEVAFHTPAPLETLLYLSRHLARHMLDVTSERPLQLKWVADILSVVERHAGTMDWDNIRRNHPGLLNRLEVFYSLTPLPEHYVNVIPIRQISPPVGCNQYPGGWPHYKVGQWKRFGLWKFLWRTFTPPSDWWLRLYYGIDERFVFWYGSFVYRIQVSSLIFWAVLQTIRDLKTLRIFKL